MDAEAEIENFAENKVYEGIFNIFELELEEISRFVAFTSGNMTAYSNKIHELHLRVCSEIENVLKSVIHKHFASADEVKTFWDTDKFAFLGEKELTNKYEELKNELNKREKGKLDKFLFGFPDFLFYFKIACEKFNLHKKVIKFTGMVSHNIDWEIIQPFELTDGRDVPLWWTNYNKLKHDKIKNYNICTLGDLIYSMSGLFILMNYLLKYQESNLPIENKNYLVDRFKETAATMSCRFCSFDSKLFQSSNAYQNTLWSHFLSSELSEEDFENLSVADLESRKGVYFKNIENLADLKIKDLDLKSFEHSMNRTIANKNDKFRSVDHSLFYSYLDYKKVANIRGESFLALRHYGIFIN